MNKRLTKELYVYFKNQSTKPLLDNDYIISYESGMTGMTSVSNNNNMIVKCLIKSPSESVYKHKFLRLNMEIPEDYPHSPPKVFLVNYDGIRIHPNMYENGKCCATILNTWGDDKYEKWTSSMNIETIIITFQSFLDNNPYKHEPGGRDSKSYTDFVKYQSWITCLIRYLENEDDEFFLKYIYEYIHVNYSHMINDLNVLIDLYPYNYYYTECFEIENYIINYEAIKYTLTQYYQYIQYIKELDLINGTSSAEIETFNDFINTECNYNCCICYDTHDINHTKEETNEFCIILKDCNHSFHKKCLIDHVEKNGSICSLCRKELNKSDVLDLKDKYITNSVTGKRIRIGGRVYQRILKQKT